jgi:lipase
MEHIDHDGRRISFEVTGSGEPIVMLPPGASPATVWRDVAKVLGRGWRTVAINFSGYGDTESFLDSRPMQLDDEGEAVFAVLANFPEPAHLVGHSYGGAVALRCCLTQPERIRSLILIEPAAYPILDESGDTELSTEVKRVNAEFVARVHAGQPALAFKDCYNYYNQSAHGWDKLPERLRNGLLSAVSTVAVGLEAIHECPTSLADCERIEQPTVLLRGEKTDPVHGALTDLLAKMIPGARHDVVSGAGHMLSLTHPHAVAGVIERHAERMRAG